MAKNKVSEWSATPADNTDVGGIDINEGCAPSGINNAIRDVMAQIKDMQTGADGDNFVVGGNLTVTGTTTLSTDLPVASGGTGASTAADARTNLGLGSIATQASSSVTITGGSITGITDLAVADGGTGVSSITAGALLLGNGASAIAELSPSTSGNFLVSNGSSWVSKIFPAFSAYSNGSQSSVNDSFTKIQCDTEEYDTNSNYDTSSYRFTPTVAGYYQVNAAFEIDNNYQCIASIYKNGSSFKESPRSANSFGSQVSALIYLNGTTDYIEFYGFVNATRAISSGDTNTYFQAFLTKS
jgi:hypothetical protein